MEEETRLCFVLPAVAPPAGASAAAVGSKAYGLMRLASLGLPVPPAFVLGTSLCRQYYACGRQLPPDTRDLLRAGLARLEAATGLQFGSARRPLLLAVRSGAPVSMPGMMETVLNVGLCQQTLPGALRITGNPRLARDCYRRLVRDFMEVVHGAPASLFDAIAERYCAADDLPSASELDSAALARIVEESLEAAEAHVGRAFPQSALEQLELAVEAVLRSWMSEKAQQYRRLNHIDDALGTAVTVQAMVFGNGGANSGAGVGFTRDPASGENRLYLDFLFNAQGEDVVSGRLRAADTARLERQLPRVAAELARVRARLEGEFHDMQDFEFTVANGALYLLQTRSGKRTPWAALQIAVDLVHEGHITPEEALARLEGLDLEHIERTQVAGAADAALLATAVPASIGVASGAVTFDSRRGVAFAESGRRVILARPDIATGDLQGIAAAEGVLTTSGGRTSHAAVVARQLGKVCLVGCTSLRIAEDGRSASIGDRRLCEGDELTLDANTGRVYAGVLEVRRERPEGALAQVAAWRAGARGEPMRLSSGA